VHLARDLTAEPPSVLTPAAFARRIEALAGHGLEVEILDGAALAQLGLRALLAVARGSDEPPFVAVLRWRGADDPHAPPVALVGKGVTFDAGGLNLKPTAFMFRMKNYMGGAAAVVGALRALAARRARVNAVGVVGLVENMPSGRAYRPGDVLQTFSGKTVEVIDTDNEGRLVLCDLVAWAEHTLAPRAIVDIATLTGGARFALGAVYAPVFANDEALCAALVAAGEAEGERLWRLPTGPAYDPMFASPVADMTNGRTDIQAHAILGARFLERFVDHTPWAHFDMAAVCTTETDLDCAPAGFTGFGAALLDRFAGG
jgi:leucyl aminopeptidase